MYRDLIIIYPKPHSIFFRGTIGFEGLGQDVKNGHLNGHCYNKKRLSAGRTEPAMLLETIRATVGTHASIPYYRAVVS